MTDPDLLFPAEPRQRDVARELFQHVRSLPLISPHGHVDPWLIADDPAFPDPARLLIVPDHYINRMLYSQGVALERLGVARRDGTPVESDGRTIWRTFVDHWPLLRGTPSRLWLEMTLVEIFDIDTPLSPATADEVYDRLSARLAEPAFRPRALFERFGIEVLATTDPPLSDLRHHRRLADEGWGDRVIPTFRPDPLLHPDRAGWVDEVTRLGELTGVDIGTYGGYLAALARRRQDFVAAGALATDHGHPDAALIPLGLGEAARIYDAGLAGTVTPDEAAAFAGHMLVEMARMSCADGLVLQLHPGVLRDHHTGVRRRYGPDRGFDIPVPVDFTRGLRPLLERYGRDPRFRMIAFTVDETTYSRELAPLAGVYPALRLGAPWWFLDSPNGLRRFRESVTETAGFYNTAGFVDDTRAFASIPARHDLARRIDAGYLARLVAEHMLDLDEATETAVDLAYTIPRVAYRRPS